MRTPAYVTHTYAILDVSPAVYEEIRAKLGAAGYEHAFHDDVIDMHGIALASNGPTGQQRDATRRPIRGGRSR